MKKSTFLKIYKIIEEISTQTIKLKSFQSEEEHFPQKYSIFFGCESNSQGGSFGWLVGFGSCFEPVLELPYAMQFSYAVVSFNVLFFLGQMATGKHSLLYDVPWKCSQYSISVRRGDLISWGNTSKAQHRINVEEAKHRQLIKCTTTLICIEITIVKFNSDSFHCFRVNFGSSFIHANGSYFEGFTGIVCTERILWEENQQI